MNVATLVLKSMMKPALKVPTTVPTGPGTKTYFIQVNLSLIKGSRSIPSDNITIT